MLSDRSYMRDDYPRERTSVLIWLISAIAAVFVMQLVLGAPWSGAGSDPVSVLALSVPSIRTGWVWTLLTYSFLHNPHFIFHVVANVFVLYLLGRELVPMLGAKRFLGLYAAATFVGGLTWLAVHWRFGGDQTLMGATASVDALFIVFACFFPDQELTFLFLFLFPVTLKPKYIAAGLVAFDLFAFLAWELPGVSLPYNATIASSAHLGGMLTGFLYYRFMYDANWFGRGHGRDVELPRWLKRTPSQARRPEPETRAAAASPEDLRVEVDRILDKINSQGFAALSAEEKRVLDDARDLLSRR